MKPPNTHGLTVQRLREVLSYDAETGIFTRLDGSLGADAAGCDNGRGYIKIRIDGKRHAAHRLAWLYAHGKWPTAYIDHINGVRGDNRVSNLREATLTQNAQNRTKVQPQSKTGVMGVHRIVRTGRFTAYIRRDNKQVHLGCFATIEDATQARAAAIEAYKATS